MSSKKVYLDYIKDMLESAEKALLFVSGMDFDQFTNDEKTIFAVIRAIEIIGEASKKIPDNFRAQYNEIPWREISGTRDKLIHEYSGVNVSIIWRTVQEDLPELISQLKSIIDQVQTKK